MSFRDKTISRLRPIVDIDLCNYLTIVCGRNRQTNRYLPVVIHAPSSFIGSLNLSAYQAYANHSVSLKKENIPQIIADTGNKLPSHLLTIALRHTFFFFF